MPYKTLLLTKGTHIVEMTYDNGCYYLSLFCWLKKLICNVFIGGVQTDQTKYWGWGCSWTCRSLLGLIAHSHVIRGSIGADKWSLYTWPLHAVWAWWLCLGRSFPTRGIVKDIHRNCNVLCSGLQYHHWHYFCWKDSVRLVQIYGSEVGFDSTS